MYSVVAIPEEAKSVCNMKDKHKMINGDEKWELELNQKQSNPEFEILSWNEILSTECISLSILSNLPNITGHQIAIIALTQATAFRTKNSTKRAKAFDERI